MFLKKAALKKLMKQAYKHAGLTVGHHMKDMEGKFIGSFAWTAWFREGHMPKEIMAQGLVKIKIAMEKWIGIAINAH